MYDAKNGIVGKWEGFPCQMLSLKPNDVLFVHVSEDMAISECEQIQKWIQKEIPNNPVLIANEHILKGFTVIQQEDVPSFIGGISNDFLH